MKEFLGVEEALVSYPGSVARVFTLSSPTACLRVVFGHLPRYLLNICFSIVLVLGSLELTPGPLFRAACLLQG